MAWPNSYLQMMVVILTTSMYVVWGVVHHHILRDLKAEIVEKALAKAEAIIKEQINSDDQEKLVDDYLEKVVA
jgi:sensor histidine kinase regulating citrate/malate metabolism